MEYKYLKLVKKILKNGITKKDRTGVGTLSIFGEQLKFNLRNNIIPLLTTKRVFWRGVVEELLWFISGDTSAKTLNNKGIFIWNSNATREFLNKVGLNHYKENDLGPIYGFQWRHFGATYVDCITNYNKSLNQGFDQLQYVINLIKTNPNSRRIIMSAWNPPDLKKVALPPCHILVQFYVANNELSCKLYQRSADVGLGVPFNIASYALLTRLIAQVCGLNVGDFIYSLGDSHIYLNHIDALQTQLKRKPRNFPTLTIDPTIKDINKFKYEHFKIHNYNPHPSIKMQMAI
jgi:thymidylate synthase